MATSGKSNVVAVADSKVARKKKEKGNMKI